MPFLTSHKYLSIAGSLRGGERFSFGLRLTTGSFGGDYEADQDLCDQMADIIANWWGNRGTIAGNAILDTVKYNLVNTEGKYAHDYTAAHYFVTPVPGGGAQSPYPNQITTVVTLETGLQRGLAHRGRVFLPAPNAPVGADGRLLEADAQGIANSFRDLLDLINAGPWSDQVIVASNTRGGAIRVVTGVSVGRVLDTMRSRRTSLEEGRMSVALAAGT